VSTLFLDTSGWLAAMSAREAAHGEAAHAAARAAYSEEVLGGGQLVTTALVLAEMQVLLLKLSGPAVGPAPVISTRVCDIGPLGSLLGATEEDRVATWERPWSH
jgi:predicted nucleic acid-binding protein